jgi:hypothetical protein
LGGDCSCPLLGEYSKRGMLQLKNVFLWCWIISELQVGTYTLITVHAVCQALISASDIVCGRMIRGIGI